MAQRTQILLVDDLDQSPADETITFGLDGVTYVIDLNNEHAREMREALAKYVAVARRSGGRRRRSTGSGISASRAETQAIREWARAKGYRVSDRGRIPAEIVSEYRASKAN